MTYKVLWFPSEEKDKVAGDLKEILLNSGFEESVSDSPDYVFVIGGDGSFFYFSKEYAFCNTRLLGIPAGKIAFSLDFNPLDLHSLNDKSWKRLELLKIVSENKVYYSMNDVYISGDLFLEADVSVDDLFLEKFKGSGLLFSTQYGSTGMNKSMLGPLFMPQNNLWLFREIGSFNAKGHVSLNSPLIMSMKNKITIRIPDGRNFNFYIDGRIIDCMERSFDVFLINGNAQVLEMSSHEYITKIKNVFLT